MSHFIKTFVLIAFFLPAYLSAQQQADIPAEAVNIPNLKQNTKASETVILLLPFFIENAVDTFPRDWWKAKAERISVETEEEPFQEDIFTEPEEEFDRFGRSRSSGFTSRGLPQRNERRATNSRNIPTEFSQRSPKRILTETEVPVEFIQTEVQLLPNNYSGYSIEILTSPEELLPDHNIFFRHGNLMMENNNGSFAYLLGKFNLREDAEQFYAEVLSTQYPDAKVVGYQYGQRTN